jgi:predicted transposase YbfD/YdcC
MTLERVYREQINKKQKEEEKAKNKMEQKTDKEVRMPWKKKKSVPCNQSIHNNEDEVRNRERRVENDG